MTQNIGRFRVKNGRQVRNHRKSSDVINGSSLGRLCDTSKQLGSKKQPLQPTMYSFKCLLYKQYKFPNNMAPKMINKQIYTITKLDNSAGLKNQNSLFLSTNQVSNPVIYQTSSPVDYCTMYIVQLDFTCLNLTAQSKHPLCTGQFHQVTMW